MLGILREFLFGSRHISPPLPGILLAGGIFLTQTYLLPLFGWSFLLLSAAWVSTGLPVPVKSWFGPMSQFRRVTIILLFAYLLLIIVTATRISSVGYLLSSMACFVLTFLVTKRYPSLIFLAIKYFIIINIFIAFLGIILLLFFDFQHFSFIDPLHEGYLRFRGLSLEPNHLGFSLNAIYILLLFSPRRIIAFGPREFVFMIASVWGLAIITLSMFTLPCLLISTLIYGWTSKGKSIKSALFVILIALFYLSSSRFDTVISGRDNSANLRTWGSLQIAQSQIEKYGILGVGLGGGREALADEPAMGDFAAHESLGLPNLFAAAMLEGGYFFAGFFLLIILFVSGFIWIDQQRDSWRGRLAMFLLLFLFAVSGSYPYDAQFWAIAAIFYVISRNKVPTQHLHRPGIPLDTHLGTIP